MRIHREALNIAVLGRVLSCVFSYAVAALGQPPQVSLSTFPHGAVERHVYTTSIARNLPSSKEAFYVYTPPGYDPRSKTRYPVLYLLHGDRQHASGWLTDGRVNMALDTLIARGKAKPMIVVMPDCYGDYKFLLGGLVMWTLPEKIDDNVALFSRMLFKEIIPQVESDYRVSKKRSDRAIAGLSMGGLEALTIGFENPGKFDWIGGFSSAVQKMTPRQSAILGPETMDFRLLWIACGVDDMRPIVVGNRRLISELKSNGVRVTAVVTPGAHEWRVWRNDFVRFAPLLFQDDTPSFRH